MKYAAVRRGHGIYYRGLRLPGENGYVSSHFEDINLYSRYTRYPLIEAMEVTREILPALVMHSVERGKDAANWRPSIFFKVVYCIS